jgi:hypothetical protein
MKEEGMADEDRPVSAEDAEKGPSEQQDAEQEYAEQNREPQSPGNARGTGTDA